MAHFHCPNDLGEAIPVHVNSSRFSKNDRSSGSGLQERHDQLDWLDVDAEDSRYAAMYGNQTALVERALELWQARQAKLSPTLKRQATATHIQIEGMDGQHSRAFNSYGGKVDVTIAQENSLADRCVNVRPEGKHEAIDSKGKKIRVDTFSVRMGYKDLPKFGCGLAVQLYFNFHVDAGFLFGLLFLVSMCAFVENVNRNWLRNDCRQLTRDFNSSTVVRVLDQEMRGDEFSNVTEWMHWVDSEDRCGYSTIEPGLNTLVPAWLVGAMGTCTEITAQTRRPQGIPGLPDTDVSIFAQLSADSAICDGPHGWSFSASYWLEFVSVLLLLTFFVRDFHMTARRAENYDQEHITTGDFAVMISGLERGVCIEDQPGKPGLTTLLIGDLENLGFSLGEHIAQVEPARVCAAEMKAMEKLATLRTQRQELRAEHKKTHTNLHLAAEGGSGGARRGAKKGRLNAVLEWMQARKEKQLKRDIVEMETLLGGMMKEKDTSSGYAYIIFQEEAIRNDFIKRTRTLTLSQRFAFGFVRWVGVARCEAIGKRLRMYRLVHSLGKLISDFDLTSERRQHLVFKSSPSVVS